MATKKIFITGATGRLGRAVLPLVDAVPLVRSHSGLENEIETDFSPGELSRILRDADCIIHLAGSVDTLDKKAMWEANVELTRRIVESAPENCRIVFAGSISIYGKKIESLPADERTEPAPDTPYAESKYGAETIVAGHRNHVILRIGPIYGPSFEDYYRILRMIERGKMQIIGEGVNRIPFVHVDDAAKAIAAAVEKGSGIYVVAGEAETQRKIFGIAARELGVAEPSKSISKNTALLMISLKEAWARVVGKKPAITMEHISILANDREFNCKKAKKDLGFDPRPIEVGIEEMIRSYRKRLYKT